MKDNILTVDNIRPGDVFRHRGLKQHYIGAIQGDKGKLHVYWHWDKRGKRRRYEVEDEDTFKIFLWMIEKGW